MTAQIGQLVRSLLSDDLESYAEQTSGLDESGWNAFSEIVGAAFYRAVVDKFGSLLPGGADPDQEDIGAETVSSEDEISGGEISIFVAEAAEPYEGTAVSIDPVAAEALVRSVLGDEAGVGPVLEELDEPDLARIELVLLRALVADGSEESVEDLITGAEGEAAEFSGEPGTDSSSDENTGAEASA
jgi:hypothetical protein